jgi:hypothetical protein
MVLSPKTHLVSKKTLLTGMTNIPNSHVAGSLLVTLVCADAASIRWFWGAIYVPKAGPNWLPRPGDIARRARVLLGSWLRHKCPCRTETQKTQQQNQNSDCLTLCMHMHNTHSAHCRVSRLRALRIALCFCVAYIWVNNSSWLCSVQLQATCYMLHIHHL